MFRVSVHLIYTSVLPGLLPSLGSEVRCLCRVTPTQSRSHLLIPSCVSQSPTPFEGVVLHGFAVLEEMETQQSLKLVL